MRILGKKTLHLPLALQEKIFTLPLNNMSCCEVQIFSNLFVTLRGAKLSMQQIQRYPNHHLEEKFSCYNIVSDFWLYSCLKLVLFLDIFKPINSFLCLSQLELDLSITCKTTDLSCLSPNQLESRVGEGQFMFLIGNDCEKVIDPKYSQGTWRTSFR